MYLNIIYNKHINKLEYYVASYEHNNANASYICKTRVEGTFSYPRALIDTLYSSYRKNIKISKEVLYSIVKDIRRKKEHKVIAIRIA